jgi:hypothetical protein
MKSGNGRRREGAPAARPVIKEMRSLGLNVELTNSKKAANDQLEAPPEAAE